jgi:hypothetical protein
MPGSFLRTIGKISQKVFVLGGALDAGNRLGRSIVKFNDRCAGWVVSSVSKTEIRLCGKKE